AKVFPPTRPNDFGSPMLATPIINVDKTKGAIINLINRKNKSPNGAKNEIDSPKLIPNIIATMKAIKICVNKLPLKNFNISTNFLLLWLFYLNKLWNIKSKCLSIRSEEHTSELQSRFDLVCRL